MNFCFIDLPKFKRQGQVKLILGLGLLLGLIVRIVYAYRLPLTNDESFYLYDGLLLSQGEWPFLTSFSRAPVLLFLNGGLVKIFGRSFLAGRMISILAGLASSYFLYLLGKSLFSLRIGIIAFLLHTLLAPCVVHTIYLHTQPLEMTFVLAGVWFVYQYLESSKRRERFLSFQYLLILAGIFFGLAVLVRETAAFYPAVMVCAILFLSSFPFLSKLLHSAIMGVSSLAVWGAVWGFIISQVGWDKVYANFIALTTMHDTDEYWSFLFKMKKKAQVVYSLLPENFILYFFSFIFVLFLASYCYSVIKHKGRTWDHSYTFLLLICAVPLGFYGFYYRRFQDEYMAEFMPPLVLTGAVGIDWLLLKIKPWLERKMQLFLLFLPAVLLGSVYALVFNYRYQWNNPHGGTHNLSAVYEAVDFVEKNAAQQEILTAAIIIPYLSDNPLAFRMSRPALFGYPQLASEIKHTLYPTDEEIIVGLRKKPISWVILDKTTRDSFFRGHPGIEKVLQKEYTVIKVVADEWTGTVYEIARRK